MLLFCIPKFRKPHSFLSVLCMCEVDRSDHASLPGPSFPLSCHQVTEPIRPPVVFMHPPVLFWASLCLETLAGFPDCLHFPISRCGEAGTVSNMLCPVLEQVVLMTPSCLLGEKRGAWAVWVCFSHPPPGEVSCLLNFSTTLSGQFCVYWRGVTNQCEVHLSSNF